MIVLSMYHVCLICTGIGFLTWGGLQPQGADGAYVIFLPEDTYIRLPEQAFCFAYGWDIVVINVRRVETG